MDLEKTSGTTESSGDASAVEKVSASGSDCSGSPVELPENKTESAETPHDVDEHYHAKRFSADDMNIEQEAPAVERYKASIEQAIEKKEYQHWATQNKWRLIGERLQSMTRKNGLQIRPHCRLSKSS